MNIEKFLGKSWDEYFKNAKDHSSCDTGRLNTHISKLKFKDLIHYGHYTSSWHQDFHLVVCDVCSQAVLPQAFLRHFQKRHVNPDGSTKISVRFNTQQQTVKATNEFGNNGRKRQCRPKRVAAVHNHHDADYQPPVAVGRRKRERLKQPAPPTTKCSGPELGVKGVKRNISPDDPLPLPSLITAGENANGLETAPPLSLNVTFPITQPSWLQERLDQAEQEQSSYPLPCLKIVLRKISSGATHHSSLSAPPSLPQQSPQLPLISPSAPPSFRVVSPCHPAQTQYPLIEDEELPLALLLSRRRRNGEQYADDNDDSSRKKIKRSQRIRRLEKARLSLEYQIHRLKTDLSTMEGSGEPKGDFSPPPTPERAPPCDPPRSSSPIRVVTRRVPLLNHPTVVDGSRFADSASRLQPLAYDLSSNTPDPPTPNSSDRPRAEGQDFPVLTTTIVRLHYSPSPAFSLGGSSGVSDRASSYMSDKDSNSSSTFTPHPSWNGSPHYPEDGGGSPTLPRFKHPERLSSSTDLACFAPFQHSYPHHHHDKHRRGFGVGPVATPLAIAGLGSKMTPVPPPYLSVDPGGTSVPYYPHLYGAPKLSNRGGNTPSPHHQHHGPKFAQKRQKSVHEMALFQKILELNSLAVESHHNSLDKEPCFKPSMIGSNHASPIGFSALSPSYKI